MAMMSDLDALSGRWLGDGGSTAVRSTAERLGLPRDIVAAIPVDARIGGVERPPAPAPAPARPLAAPPADLVLIRAGLRPAALLHGPESWVAGLCAWAAARGLTAIPSATAFRPLSDPALGSYSNLTTARHRASGDPADWRAVAVSPSPLLAEFVWLAEARGWDIGLGLALGYPACCVEAFVRDWPEAACRHGGDVGRMRLPTDGEATDIPFLLNIFARYDGPVVTDHFPCSWRCAASLARARRMVAGLAAMAPALLKDMQERMRRDIVLGTDGWTFGAHRTGDRVTVFKPAHERIA
jgi:hypothetical protein